MIETKKMLSTLPSYLAHLWRILNLPKPSMRLCPEFDMNTADSSRSFWRAMVRKVSMYVSVPTSC